MVTIFSPMRPFVRDIGQVQKQAISSWLNIIPECEVIIIDDEDFTSRTELEGWNVKILTTVKKAESGAPLLDSMFEEVIKVAKYDIICYITADVLLPQNFCEDILQFDKQANDKFGDYLGICCRYDQKNPDVSKGSLSDNEYFELCLKNGVKRERSGIDLWVFRKTTIIPFPPFPIGRCLTDNWVVYYCRYHNIKVLDFSDQIKIIHQYHSKPAKSNPFFQNEKEECHLIFENAAMLGMDLYDAELMYSKKKGFYLPGGMRLLYSKLSKFWPYRVFLSMRRKAKNPLYKLS